MDPEAIALFRELADRSPSEREAYFAQHQVPAALRTEVESLLRFDGEPADSIPGHVAAAAQRVLHGNVLEPGARLGPYEIVAPVGAGGMGEVYKARDTRLDRTVAIKVLPADVASNPDLKRRFEREARMLAALSHPHICPVFDVGQQDNTDFLVMEYLEGETLADRLAKGSLPLDQSLRYAIQIADALDTAHRAGIVHRDLKPGNIMLTTSGAVRQGSPRARLLDFGLAKLTRSAFGSQLSRQPTTPPMTERGTILGTVQYMAPEQLEGREADARTDLFAFGAVVYEMLTGKKAFEGKSSVSLIAAIMQSEPPPISATQPLTPPALDRIVKRCLDKDPDGRWQTARDLLAELRWVAEPAGVAAGLPASTPRARWREYVLGTVAVGGAIAAAIALMKPSSPATADVTRTLISVAPAEQLQHTAVDQINGEGRPSRTTFALSPDGRSLVFSAVRAGQQQLYLRKLNQLEATPIAGTEGGAIPFFSPDGQWVGFWVAPQPGGQLTRSGGLGALKKVGVAGGPAVTLCETEGVASASWGSNGTIVFEGFQRLLQVSASGGVPTPVTTLDATQREQDHRHAHLLPGGRVVLFTVIHNLAPRWEDDTEIVAQSLATGERTILIRGGAEARYVPGAGHLLYVRHGKLMAVPFDPDRVAVTGNAVGFLDDVLQAADAPGLALNSGAAQVSVSDAGSLVYLSGGTFPAVERTLVWVDRRGKVQPLGAPPRAYLSPRLDPTGRQRLLVWTQTPDFNLWLYDLSRKALTPRTVTEVDTSPIWTPDGSRFAFTSSPEGINNIFWRSVEGSEPAERLTTSQNIHYPSSWSPDGQTLAFVEVVPTIGPDISVLSLTGDRRPRPVLQTRFFETSPEFSPDGSWLAYVSDESGRNEVYVEPYPGPGARQQISTEGGDSPAWSRDGRELFYAALPSPESSGRPPTGTPVRRMLAVPVRTQPVFMAGPPKVLFEGAYLLGGTIRGYDVTPDGRRFLIVQPKDRPPFRPTQMILVQNWIEELKRRGPSQ